MLELLLAAAIGGSGGGGNQLPYDADFKSVAFLSAADGNSGVGSHTPFINEASGATMTPVDATALTAFQGALTPTGNLSWAYRFANGEGTISAINLPASNTAWVFTGDFTVRFWFKATGGPSESTVRCLIGTGWASGTPWEIFYNSTGLGLTSSSLRIQGTTPIAQNVWHHVECSRVGSVVRLFLNGVQQGTWNWASTIGDATTGRVLRLGNANGTARFFGGLIADVYVNNTTGGNTSNFTPSTETPALVSGTTLLVCHKPYLLNEGTGGTATVQGQVFGYPEHPSGRLNTNPHTSSDNGGSLTLSQSHLSGSDSAIGAIGTGDFTIEGWVYLNNPAISSRGSIFSSYGGVTEYGFGIIWDTNRIPVLAIGRNTSGAFTQLISPTAMNFGQWYWLVGTRQSGVLSLYINGVRVGTVAGTRDCNSPNYVIGRYYNDVVNTAHNVAAHLANIRVLNYCAYTGTTIPVPTTAPADISGTIFLYRGGSVNVADATQKTNIRFYNGAGLSDTVTKWGPTALLFNGTTQYAETEPSTELFLSSVTSWTVEAWINPSSLSVEMSVFGFGDGGTSFSTNLNGWVNVTAAGQLEFGYTNGTTNLVVTSTGLNIQANQWNHIAVVFDGATKNVELMANGIRGYSGVISTYAPGQRRPRLTIGRRPTAYTTAPRFYAGSVDDPRISVQNNFSSGKRYSGSTYTVPSASFPIR